MPPKGTVRLRSIQQFDHTVPTYEGQEGRGKRVGGKERRKGRRERGRREGRQDRWRGKNVVSLDMTQNYTVGNT